MYLVFTFLYLMTYFKLLFMVLNLQLNAQAQGCNYIQLQDRGCKSFLKQILVGPPCDRCTLGSNLAQY